MQRRQWTTIQTMDDDAGNDAATQMTGDDTEDINAAVDVNARMQTTRWRNNQPEKRRRRP